MEDDLTLELRRRRDTRRLGAALGSLLAAGDVVWLEGELGAGKTFLARGLLRALGVPQAVPVTSPTFALVHEHEGRMPIRHLDLYRLRGEDEVRELGLEEAMEDAVLVVEWGAHARAAIGARGVELSIATGEHRVATLRGLDARGRALVERLRAIVAPAA